jgi:hypothetical protein
MEQKISQFLRKKKIIGGLKANAVQYAKSKLTQN